MILGIGIDTVEIKRVQKFIDDRNQPLLDRLFTKQEQTHCMQRKQAAECLAARFAAKEAFLKALGTGLRDGLCFCEIETTNNELGKPELSLSGLTLTKAAEYGAARIHLSISHDGGNAVAMVVLETQT